MLLTVTEHWAHKGCVSHFARSGGASATQERALPSAAVLSYPLATSRCAGGQSTGVNPIAQKDLEETRLWPDPAELLPVRSLLLGNTPWVLRAQGGLVHPILTGIVAGSLPGCCRLPGCRPGHCPASPVAPGQCPGHRTPAEVVVSCRLKTRQRFEGVFLRHVHEIVGYCRSALTKSC